MTIITTNNDRKYQTVGMGKTIAAVAVGGGAYAATALTQLPFAKYCTKQAANTGQSCDSVILNKGVDKAFENFKLATKGVEIVDINEKTPASPIFEKLPKWLRGIVDQLEIIKEGKNAAFSPDYNSILVNEAKFNIATFHEMGHAVNYNFSKFWKGMQKSRIPCMTLGGLFGSIALFKRKKVDGEKPKNSFDEFTTFIKNNVGKLVLISSVPVVAEELMATHRGNSMAKKVLSPELFKKVQTVNRWGATAYIASAVGSALAAVAGSKIRDALAKPKEITD